MKITPEDLDAIREVLGENPTRGSFMSERDTALALILVKIYDRGYEAAQEDNKDWMGL